MLVAGVGTGGTITGAGEYLKARNPKLRVVAVEPASSAVLSGGRPGPHQIQGIGAGFVPAVLNRELLDEIIAGRRRGRDRDRAARRAPRGRARRHLVRRGAVGRRCRSPARPESPGLRIVVVLPDSGERYVSVVLRRSLRRRSDRARRGTGTTQSNSWRNDRLRFGHARPRAFARVARGGPVATCAPRTTATRPRAASARSRSSPRGPASTPCSPTASRTRSTTPACRSLPRLIADGRRAR